MSAVNEAENPSEPVNELLASLQARPPMVKWDADRELELAFLTGTVRQLELAVGMSLALKQDTECPAHLGLVGRRRWCSEEYTAYYAVGVVRTALVKQDHWSRGEFDRCLMKVTRAELSFLTLGAGLYLAEYMCIDLDDDLYRVRLRHALSSTFRRAPALWRCAVALTPGRLTGEDPAELSIEEVAAIFGATHETVIEQKSRLVGQMKQAAASARPANKGDLEP